jgi:hypothetical protein
MKKRALKVYCTVCGNKHHGNKCSQAFWNAVDAADSAAWNKELDSLKQPYSAAKRPFWLRLQEGFQLLDMMN